MQGEGRSCYVSERWLKNSLATGYPAVAAMLYKFAVESSAQHDRAVLDLQVHDSLCNAELAATRQVELGLTGMPIGDAAGEATSPARTNAVSRCFAAARVVSPCYVSRTSPIQAR